MSATECQKSVEMSRLPRIGTIGVISLACQIKHNMFDVVSNENFILLPSQKISIFQIQNTSHTSCFKE